MSRNGSKCERYSIRLVVSKEGAKELRRIEREQKHISDSIAIERKRISDSIAIERKRVSDSIATEKEMRKQKQLAQEKEMMESIYGKWTGKGELIRIELYIEDGKLRLYDYGEEVYNGSCKMKIDKGIVRLSPSTFSSQIEKKLGRTYTTNYVIEYDPKIGFISLEYRYWDGGTTYNHSIYLSKDTKKKR